MRSIKRIVDTDFWDNDKVLDEFSIEDKYFYLFLLTNPFTTQLGIYPFPLKKASFYSGFSVEKLQSLLDRFETQYGWIKYSPETSEIAVKGYLKHTLLKGGKPVIDLLMKEIKEVKNQELISYMFNSISNTNNNTINIFINSYTNTNIVGKSYHESYHDSLYDSSHDSYDDSSAFYPENIKLQNRLQEFFEMRKSIKKPMTDRARQLLFNKLEKLSDGDQDVMVQILEQSIFNNWQGIYPLKEQKELTPAQKWLEA